MKLKVLMEHVIMVRNAKLCDERCPGAEADYPLWRCNLFNGMRQESESEDVGAYLRLPECLAKATWPYKPWLPKVGEEMVFLNTKQRHKVAEVRELPDSADDYEARLEPPLDGPYIYWVWVSSRNLSREPLLP